MLGLSDKCLVALDLRLYKIRALLLILGLLDSMALYLLSILYLKDRAGGLFSFGALLDSV